MRPNKVRELWNNGQPAVSAWLSIGNSYSAELIGACGVDAVTVDLQHGMIDPHAMIPMLQAISATPATPFVRVPSVEAAVIMKVIQKLGVILESKVVQKLSLEIFFNK